MSQADALIDAGFRVTTYRPGGSWRCGRCLHLNIETEARVWVPDEIREDDQLSLVKEKLRLSRDFTAWCVRCASRLLSR